MAQGPIPFVPAYFHAIAHKLSTTASQAYLRSFGVGLEGWRILMLLANDDTWSPSQICASIGMDKAAVSRGFKTLEQDGLLVLRRSHKSSRHLTARITSKGREVHDQIMERALARQEALLSVLTLTERELLIDILERLRANLPAVEAVTQVAAGRHSA